MQHLYDAGLTTEGIIFLSMLAVLALAWIGNEWSE
jgi:hypothetical protein